MVEKSNELFGAEKATETSELEKNPTVAKGNTSDMPAQMTVSSLENAGWSYIYDTRTGERSLSNNNMLRANLSKRRADGSLVFSTIPPSNPPARGKLKCLLHPDSVERDKFDAIGLPVCKKSNFTSQYEVNRHMQKKHKSAWAVLEQERIEREKKEQSDMMKSLIEIAKKK